MTYVDAYRRELRFELEQRFSAGERILLQMAEALTLAGRGDPFNAGQLHDAVADSISLALCSPLLEEFYPYGTPEEVD